MQRSGSESAFKNGNPRVRQRRGRLFHFNRPDVDVARLHDEKYVYQIYERVFASSVHQSDNRRRYDSTPIESEWLREEIYHLCATDPTSSDIELGGCNSCNGTSTKVQAVKEAISTRVNRIIAEVLCGDFSRNNPPNGMGLKSQRPRKNSVDSFTDVLNFSSAQNNSCFLEKQLLLVKRAQEMLLDEYRLGNSSKTQHNRPTYRESAEMKNYSEDSREDSDSIHVDPSGRYYKCAKSRKPWHYGA